MTQDAFTTETGLFSDLHLNPKLLNALEALNYVKPTPIQAQIIPHLITGCDVVGQAQTGTGKTASFALPLLQNLNPQDKRKPQILVLAPTRELAIQVSESFSTYGQYIPGLKVLPIYGGQNYSSQLQQLRRGVHIVVGTPGRIMDHIRRNTLDLSALNSVVLDEADEMLKMGFIDDVTWILEQTPSQKQIALFSATMPPSIRKIARKHLVNPVEITVESTSSTGENIEQSCLITKGRDGKKEALIRILEAENFDGILIFARTKAETIELTEYLCEKEFRCGALNGDIPQEQRLRIVDQLKTGKLDIVVATDVAARGLDVDRISHVINYDSPHDTEAYIHRIGRTGRAGRTGKAILFLAPREKRLLKNIERQTGCSIRLAQLPTAKAITQRRVEAFKEKLTAALGEDCSWYETLLHDYCQEYDIAPEKAAAALASLMHQKKPLLMKEEPKQQPVRNKKEARDRVASIQSKDDSPRKQGSTRSRKPEPGMERFRIEVGFDHGVTPGNIVGAIANEADIDSEFIGRISIFGDYSTVDLPYGMPNNTLKILQKARIYNRMMQMKRENQLHGDLPSPQDRKKRARRKPSKNSSSARRPSTH
ncbi:DEAD/DEAH box helicase [Desulfogranum japonicum]|uniref:DEAD/DEAH box helicase n=1 Tax=Desulfogranum japonicum TaxID=231447 RepID=UPI000413BEAD|nr:DEAD/DEAH box helicase [Desulfogranum japonicum]